MAVNLPQEIIDEILSYGDVAVTQRYKSVIIQINYHIKMLAVDSRAMPLYAGRFNMYSGISENEFYLYILDKAYIKKHIYRDAGKFFRTGYFINYAHNLW